MAFLKNTVRKRVRGCFGEEPVVADGLVTYYEGRWETDAWLALNDQRFAVYHGKGGLPPLVVPYEMLTAVGGAGNLNLIFSCTSELLAIPGMVNRGVEFGIAFRRGKKDAALRDALYERATARMRTGD